MYISLVSFGKYYKVVGDKKQMEQLRILVADEKKKSNNQAVVYNLTHHSAVPKSISDKLDGKQLCVVVTGQESIKETNKYAGKELYNLLLSSSEKLLKLGSNVKRDAVEILQSIKANK